MSKKDYRIKSKEEIEKERWNRIRNWLLGILIGIAIISFAISFWAHLKNIEIKGFF